MESNGWTFVKFGRRQVSQKDGYYFRDLLRKPAVGTRNGPVCAEPRGARAGGLAASTCAKGQSR